MRIEAEPRFYTPRNPNRQTLGRKVGKVMSVIDPPRRIDGGRGPMPWQQYVLDVACEIDPATGLYWYREVDVVVVRQAGKTSISRGKITHRAITTPKAPILYTAQDRNMALRRLEKAFYDPLVNSPLAPYLLKLDRKTGAERLRFRNGAEIFIIAASKKVAGHGESAIPEAHLDEYFAAHDFRLEQGVGPSQIAAAGAQKWILSAAGDGDSVALWAKVEAGRARCEAGEHGRVAYFEFSAPPDADRDDPNTWARWHPAVGYTIDLEDIQAEHDQFDSIGKPEEFDRPYLGWWPTAKAKPWVIPKAAWEDCQLPEGAETDWEGEPVWSVDVSPERDWAAIGLAGETTGARCYLEASAHEPGTDWVVPHLVGLAGEHGGQHVVVDGTAPAASLIPDLEGAGFTVKRLSRREVVDACGGLYDDVLNGYVRHDGDPDLTDALASAAKRASGDAWVFVRGRSLADITTLYSVTLARFGFVELAPDNYDPVASVG